MNITHLAALWVASAIALVASGWFAFVVCDLLRGAIRDARRDRGECTASRRPATSEASRTAKGRWPVGALLAAAIVVMCSHSVAELVLRADESTGGPARSEESNTSRSEPGDLDSERAATAVPGPDEPLKLPEGWPEDHPAPQVASNCVRCHLYAGRQLSAAVVHFAHSVHDLNQMSCADCHGGNTENDVLAHEDDEGFIGTKLSTHLQKCRECHDDAAEVLDAGPHQWDFSERINYDYPMCLDCHGNHDVANPPLDFTLTSICQDCHESFDDDYPLAASLVDKHDQLWSTLRQVRRRYHGDSLLPPALTSQREAIRHETMLLVHGLGDLSDERVERLNAQADELRAALEAWLAELPAGASESGSNDE